MGLRRMKEGNTELVKNKTVEQPLRTPTPALVDGRKIVGSGTGRSETSHAVPQWVGATTSDCNTTLNYAGFSTRSK